MDSARWTPVTSWPASAALAAATAESTPPDMAASTRSRFIAYEGIRPADVTGALPGYGVAGFQPGGQLAEAPCAAPPAGHDAPGHPVKRRRAWWPGYGSARRGAAGPLHYLTDRGAEAVHVLLGRGVAEREPQRTACPGVVRAHREQHMAWLRHACRAGRAGGAGDALRVEQHQQRVALAAGEREMGVARQPGRPGRRAVQHCVGHRGADSCDQVVPERGQPLRLVVAAHPRYLHGGGEGPDRRGVERAGPYIALLPAAVQDRHRIRAPVQQQRACADRAADLVPGD